MMRVQCAHGAHHAKRPQSSGESPTELDTLMRAITLRILASICSLIVLTLSLSLLVGAAPRGVLTGAQPAGAPAGRSTDAQHLLEGSRPQDVPTSLILGERLRMLDVVVDRSSSTASCTSPRGLQVSWRWVNQTLGIVLWTMHNPTDETLAVSLIRGAHPMVPATVSATRSGRGTAGVHAAGNFEGAKTGHVFRVHGGGKFVYLFHRGGFPVAADAVLRIRGRCGLCGEPPGSRGLHGGEPLRAVLFAATRVAAILLPEQSGESRVPGVRFREQLGAREVLLRLGRVHPSGCRQRLHQCPVLVLYLWRHVEQCELLSGSESLDKIDGTPKRAASRYGSA
eukprot:ctg_1147.g233